jgi:colanic acid/amylovoran biosynthesis glycosyltransferase
VKTIAYLTSAYARASDSFIRAEVLRLREAGLEVLTYSVLEPPAAERVSGEIRDEHARTDYILKRGPLRLAACAALEIVRAPASAAATLALALRCGWPGLKGRLWPLAYFLEACYLARRLREHRVEHLHNHIGEGSAAVAMLAASLAGIPYSLTIHGPGEFDRPALLALREKVKRSRFTAAISEHGRSQLMRWTDPEDWGRIHVVRCGVRIQEPAPPRSLARRLVCVGRLSAEKGHLVLLDALARLKAEPHFEVLVVGDGPMRGRIEEAARALGVADRVHLAGWRAAEGVREAILESRAMVLPSFAEGLPVVLMEAFALGRPVIATAIAGIPELVEPGVSGWLVAPGSGAALAEAIRAVLSAGAGRLAEMGRAGRQKVLGQHDQHREVARLRSLMEGEGDAPAGSTDARVDAGLVRAAQP